MCFDFLNNSFSVTIVIITRIERDMIKMCVGFDVKVPVIIVQF